MALNLTKAKTIKNQILAIRDTGKVNMLDARGVQQWAIRFSFLTLVDFIENHKSDYVNFIMTGDDKWLKEA